MSSAGPAHRQAGDAEATAFRRVRDGRLVEGFATWDWLTALEQLGATVTVGAAVLELRAAAATASGAAAE